MPPCRKRNSLHTFLFILQTKAFRVFSCATSENHACSGPSKKLIALRDRYRGDTLQQVATKLSDAIPELEAELATIDADVAAKEQVFFESLAPAMKYRSEVACELARARVALHYVA